MTIKQWNAGQIPDQSGRIAIITGANSGLGLETAQVLAQRGATVILACRSRQNGERARDEILKKTPLATLSVAQVDVSDLGSVTEFSAYMLGHYGKLDLLINNAGIMATPQRRSHDGFEMQFATNHLGHFALTGRLLPLLTATPGSRVIALASIAAQTGKIDFDDLMGEKHYHPWKAYNQSKLANLMFARELQRRLAASGAPTVAVAAHPGASTTNLFNTPGGVFVKKIMSPLMRVLFQPAEQGALPILYAATAPDATPGGYYGPDGFKEMKGVPAPAMVPPQALDQDAAHRLWEVSEELTGVRYL